MLRCINNVEEHKSDFFLGGKRPQKEKRKELLYYASRLIFDVHMLKVGQRTVSH